MADIGSMSFEERIEIAIRRSFTKLPAAAQAQIGQLLTPQALGITSGVLAAWIISHGLGVGELIDVILAATGILSIGLAIFTGLDELWMFTHGTYYAKSESDLDAASGHFAQAVTILSVQAVLAVLLKNSPRGPHERLRGNLPRTPGSWRYKPTTTEDPSKWVGEGETDLLGNIEISSQGSAREKALALQHERVHQLLAPKFYPLRRFRIENRFRSYFETSLWRYCEEALAETTAKVGVDGLEQGFEGIRFPMQQNYVYILKGGGYSAKMKGRGVLPEGAALVANGIVQGIGIQIWLKAATTNDDRPARLRAVGRSLP